MEADLTLLRSSIKPKLGLSKEEWISFENQIDMIKGHPQTFKNISQRTKQALDAIFLGKGEIPIYQKLTLYWIAFVAVKSMSEIQYATFPVMEKLKEDLQTRLLREESPFFKKNIRLLMQDVKHARSDPRFYDFEEMAKFWQVLSGLDTQDYVLSKVFFWVKLARKALKTVDEKGGLKGIMEHYLKPTNYARINFFHTNLTADCWIVSENIAKKGSKPVGVPTTSKPLTENSQKLNFQAPSELVYIPTPIKDLKIQKQQKQFPCQTCKKIFNSSRGLRRHVNVKNHPQPSKEKKT